MTDDKTKSQAEDRERINVQQEYEVRNWSRSLGVSTAQLRVAVAAVGDRAEKVREYLHGK